MQVDKALTPYLADLAKRVAKVAWHRLQDPEAEDLYNTHTEAILGSFWIKSNATGRYQAIGLMTVMIMIVY